MKKKATIKKAKEVLLRIYSFYLYKGATGGKCLKELFMRIYSTKRLTKIKSTKKDSLSNLSSKQNQLTREQSNPCNKNQDLIQVLPGEKIRLVFLVITPEVWASIEPVWNTARFDNRFSCSIVVLQSQNTDVALLSFIKSKALLEKHAISYFTENSFCIEEFKPHVVFCPLPYGCLYPKTYKPDSLVAMGCRIAYIPYGLEVGGGVFNMRYQFDTEVPRAAWRIFARSAFQHRNFGHFCSYGNGHVVLTGHPRYELTINQQLIESKNQFEQANGQKVILWTPHFTVSTRRKWSSFLDNHELIIRLIDERPDLFLLIRPHPFLKTNLEKLDDWGPLRVESWFRSIDNKDNMQIDNEIDYQGAFAASDALMTDTGSFLTEYLLTGKPICHLRGKDDIGLSDEARELDCYYSGETEHDIVYFLDQVVIDRLDTKQGARKHAINSYFYQAEQKTSKIVLDVISNDISDPPRRKYSAMPPVSKDHNDAINYWQNAETTYLAPETYYQKQEEVLREILSKYAKGRYAADIGCGDGRFTQIISEHFSHIEAVDPSKILIEKAIDNATKTGISNITYAVDNLEDPESLSTYDFVSCMGVTSGLIDDEVFIRSIWKLKAAMKPGAMLLMKDSLSLSTTQLIKWNGYTARYRNHADYLASFSAVGLKLVEKCFLDKNVAMQRINCMFLFEEN